MTIDMTRHSGDKNLPVVECTDTRLQKYRVRTDLRPDYDEETEEQHGVTFIETEFAYKPSMDEVKEFCFGVINTQTDMKILTGFVWTPEGGEPINVWLSAENQRNFSEADRKAEKNLEILPIVFKIGEQEGTPLYHTFETYEELDEFYKQAFAHIQQCLQEGWEKKDNFDFTPYEQALNPVVAEEATEEVMEETQEP